MKPILYIVIPVYNEEAVLPVSSVIFLDKLSSLIEKGAVNEKSRILFVDDGSKDKSWEIISDLSEENELCEGVALSRNFGHQKALLAGLSFSSDKSDITISIDCDGQDDINAMDKMIDEYYGGADIVYGVRSSRKKDSFLKRTTAQGFYKFMKTMGADVVYNHADYRLISSRALKSLLEFKEANLFLRGMLPLVGFKSTCVTYERNERLAGKTHYPLKKMISLAIDGITSLSTKPIRIITTLGFVLALISFVGVIWSVFSRIFGYTVEGWASIISIVCFLGGINLLSLGIIGEYVGKIYLETKNRPRFIIKENTVDKEKN